LGEATDKGKDEKKKQKKFTCLDRGNKNLVLNVERRDAHRIKGAGKMQIGWPGGKENEKGDFYSREQKEALMKI